MNTLNSFVLVLNALLAIIFAVRFSVTGDIEAGIWAIFMMVAMLLVSNK